MSSHFSSSLLSPQQRVIMTFLLAGSNCYCQDWHGCIMSKTVVGQDNVQPSKFSKCSVDDYHHSLQSVEETNCLLHTPSKVWYRDIISDLEIHSVAVLAVLFRHYFNALGNSKVIMDFKFHCDICTCVYM